MMRILVLGTGMQGKAAIHDLANSPDVTHIVAADQDIEELEASLAVLKSKKIRAVKIDATDEDQVKELFADVQATIVLLPPEFRFPMARLAVESGVHVIDASYALPEYKQLEAQARSRQVVILPECGLDPGIDLVVVGRALKMFDEIHTLNAYGAGVPEPAASNNPLKYKISWTLAGVLRSYTRPARLVREGRIVEIPGDQIFSPVYAQRVTVDGLGELEAYPNGDAVKFLKLAGILDTVQNAGRYSMRWPGQSAFWGTMAGLGLLSDTLVQSGKTFLSPRDFLHDVLEPQLHYASQERDVAIVLVEVEGLKNGAKRREICRVLDYRDLETGFYAMQRTVGFTASIAAQMILRGEITGSGLLSPMLDIPVAPFFTALRQRGIVLEILES
jgi:saccharopine dehydrogenase-like NADP-dependent oxidoreductase